MATAAASVVHVPPLSVDSSTSAVGTATPPALAVVISIPEIAPAYVVLTSSRLMPVPPLAVTGKLSVVAVLRPAAA